MLLLNRSMVSKDDPRLATEDDLRNYIGEFKVYSAN